MGTQTSQASLVKMGIISPTSVCSFGGILSQFFVQLKTHIDHLSKSLLNHYGAKDK